MTTADLHAAQTALALANHIRAERARFKRQLRGLETQQAQRMVAALIERPPSWAETWRLAELLRSVPRRGAVWAKKQCRHVGVSETKRLGEMTPRQRAEFVWLLGDGPEAWERP